MRARPRRGGPRAGWPGLRSTRLLAGVVVAVTVGLPVAAAGQAVPTPESVLGFQPGADFRLATYEESLEYFRRLAEASDRVQLVEAGRTSFGRPWFFALVSSPDNLRELERYRDAWRALGDPSSLSDAEARGLARTTPALVDINGGLHATEVAGAQHTIRLAYDLVAGADTDPRVAEVLDRVVVMLWPSLNPDGQTMVAEWYRSNVGTPYEVAPVPFLYQKYIGHDNNRDAYMLDMLESRVLARTWREWGPQIIYVHHQSSPFPTRIWLPPFAEPVASGVPPLVSREVNAIGMLIAQALDSREMPGAVHMGSGYDAWYPGYVDYLPMFRHQVAFWTETAAYQYATPRFYTVRDFPANRRDLRVESLYASPWKGGWWRLGDAVDYMRVASMAVLEYAAKYREDLLYNRYQSGRDAVREGGDGPVFWYLVPPDQRDPVAPVELLRRLAFLGVRVRRLSRAVTLEGVTHPAGTWVVPMNQPMAPLVRELMEPQDYPDLREYPQGPPEQPYDAAGWTLPYQMGVRVVAAHQPIPADVAGAVEPVRGDALPWDAAVEDAAPFDSPPGVGFDSDAEAAGIVPPEGRITGSGPALRLDPAQNNTFRAVNRAWDAGGRVRLDLEGREGPRYVVTGLEDGAVRTLVSDLALRAERGPERGVDLPRPRVALYRPWRPSMDEGWTRWLLERWGFAFDGLGNADVRAGGLAERYDVVLLPSESAGFFRNGFAEGSVPPRYAGGLGEEGIRELDAFVREGGTLVALSRASDFVIDALSLPVENVVSGLGRQEFFAGGSILEVETDPTQPVMAGMPERAAIFYDQSPVFTTAAGFEGRVLATYATEGSPLLSGYLLGEDHLHGYAAAVEVRHGRGRVVLLGMRPQWRGQPFGTFRILFNAALFTRAVAEAAPDNPDFWSPPEGGGGAAGRGADRILPRQ